MTFKMFIPFYFILLLRDLFYENRDRQKIKSISSLIITKREHPKIPIIEDWYICKTKGNAATEKTAVQEYSVS